MDWMQIAIGAVIGAIIVSYIWYRANEDDKEHQRNIRKAERVNKFEERIYTLENKMAGAQHRIEQLESVSKKVDVQQLQTSVSFKNLSALERKRR